MSDLVSPVVEIVEAAGRRIMEIYERGFETTLKADNSPLTEADLASHHLIVEGLTALDASIPILSEEAASIPYEERKGWKRFWLVDPLDGTKEFVNRTGEFTVNIALIEDGEPTMGVVGTPPLGLTYIGDSSGAFRIDADGKRPIHCREYTGGPVGVVASRSHAGAETEAWLEKLRAIYPEVDLVSKGSSLKFCLVAEGSAHVYPRLGPTMEWDIAAAYAVVKAAGATITNFDGNALAFNKEDLHNPFFLVRAPGLQVPS